MEINKYNKNIVGMDEINFHDLLIRSVDFNIKNRELSVKITDYHAERFNVRFYNVFDFLFTHRDADIISQNDSILDWFEIPNKVIKDNYIDEVKNAFLSNGGEWNEELFAISFLLSDISKFKVICEKIYIEKI